MSTTSAPGWPADMTDEPDRHPSAPHPRETAALFGQEAAERAFLAAEAGGRLHHAWLLTGPRGSPPPSARRRSPGASPDT